MGGLARKATILDQLNKERKNTIVVDAGDLFFKKNTIDPGVTTETARVNADVILKSFNKMGCDAFSPGSKDFSSGLDFLMKLYNKADFPFISCNLSKKGGGLLFDSHIIKRINKTNIGIIGATSFFENEVDGVIVLDPINSVDSIISQIESKVDIIILLVNGSDQDIQKFYDRNYPIDLIVRSRSKTRSSDGGSKIPTYVCGDRGKYVYQFDMTLVGSEYPFVDIAWCNNTLDRMQSRLDKMKKNDVNVDLKYLYRDDKTTLDRIKNYEYQIELANQRLENAINTIAVKKIELGKTIFDRPDILKIVDKGKLEIKELIGPELPPGPDHQGRLPGDPHYNHGH